MKQQMAQRLSKMEHLVVVALFACFGKHNSYFLSKIAKESSVEGSWGDHDQFRQK